MAQIPFNPNGQLAWIVPLNPDSNMSKELYFRHSKSERWRHWTTEFPHMGPPNMTPGYGVFCQLVKAGWQVVETKNVFYGEVDHAKSSESNRPN